MVVYSAAWWLMCASLFTLSIMPPCGYIQLYCALPPLLHNLVYRSYTFKRLDLTVKGTLVKSFAVDKLSLSF